VSARVEKVYREFALQGRPGTLPIYGPNGRAVEDVARRLHSTDVAGARTRAVRIAIECQGGGVRVLDTVGVHADASAVKAGELETLLFQVASPATLFVDRFEQLTIPEQALFVRQVRARREKLSGIPLQLVVAGAWRPFALREYWRSSEASSPFDEVRLTEVEFLSQEEVELQLEGAIDSFNSEHGAAIAALVHSQTAGDPEVVESYVELARGSHTPYALEEIAIRLEDQECVQSIVLGRCAALTSSARARAILVTVLQYQSIALAGNDLDAELLFTSGLIRPLDRLRTSKQNAWVPSSPVVAGALRRAWSSRGGHARGWPDELMPPTHPAVVQAAALVCEIENLLRNAIALALAEDAAGERLEDRITACAPHIAGEAQARRRRDVNVPLVTTPFLTFFEISDIEGVIAGELWGPRFARCFGEKGEFLASLHEFGRLRAAVAHNKIYSVRVLADLRRLLRTFRTALGMAASRALDAVHEATALEVKHFEVTPIPGRELLVRAVVRNGERAAISSARVEFSMLSSSGRVLATVPFGNPVTLAAEEEKPMTVKVSPDAITEPIAGVEAVARR
jgi:hypothetical protein